MSTAFQIRNNEHYYICKNQDVNYNGVYLFTNQRGMKKTAMIPPPAIPASWVSTYGSVVISQIGRENPNGGMNEAGLVIEQTTLWQTEYPASDDLPAIGELQWIQYMLDTCKSVEEVMKAALTIRIDQSTSKLHYMIADRSGDCAIIEFIGGSIVIHRDQLKVPVMTNTPYEAAYNEVQSGITTWVDRDEYERNSMERYYTVHTHLNSYVSRDDTVTCAFQILNQARREDTIFSLVYDLSRLQIYVVTNQNKTRRLIQLDRFDFTQNTTPCAADLQSLSLEAEAGDVPFIPYTTAFNLRAVESFFRDPLLTSIFQWHITDEMIHYVAQYPESFNRV